MKEPIWGELVCEDGTRFAGISFGARRSCAGEVVFNTGMVGYPESLSDPSYRGQILVLTYTLVGNYGVPLEERDEHGLPIQFESDRPQVAGLVVSDYSDRPHHWSRHRPLGEWLAEHGVPAIHGVDTRALTKRIRSRGAMLGKLLVEGAEEPEWCDPNRRNLVAEVSRTAPLSLGTWGPRILVYDCGIKANILRLLLRRGVRLEVVPWDHRAGLGEYDGVFVSNGPGDPAQCGALVSELRRVLASDLPVFGICLGNQLLARAAGAETYKLPFGHRSQNQPSVDLTTGRCYITPQNHGYAVREGTHPRGWEPYFRNANDGTNEGIRRVGRPVMAVQFHPEAKGGPSDTEYLFDRFLAAVAEVGRRRGRAWAEGC
jgi:carbamoyl-phosphate synthase small subunit